MFGVATENTAFDGRMGFTSNIVYTFVYNTKAVQESDVPKSWTDVLDPRLKGKMIASVFLTPRFVGALGIAWGEDKALQFARDLREKTDILLTRAPRESLLQSGERVISVGEIDSQVRAWIAEGLPLEFVVPEPVIVGQFGASVMAKAPNPSAARLLAGCLASDEGKAAREKATSPATIGPTATSDSAKLHAGGVQVDSTTLSRSWPPRKCSIKKAGDDHLRPGEVRGDVATVSNAVSFPRPASGDAVLAHWMPASRA